MDFVDTKIISYIEIVFYLVVCIINVCSTKKMLNKLSFETFNSY